MTSYPRLCDLKSWEAGGNGCQTFDTSMQMHVIIQIASDIRMLSTRAILTKHAQIGRSSTILRHMTQITKPSWATADPTTMGIAAEPYAVSNLVGGKWTKANSVMSIPDPLNKNAQPIFTIPDTQVDELGPWFESLRKVPKSGMHNPLKNPDRYVKYGEISRKVGRSCRNHRHLGSRQPSCSQIISPNVLVDNIGRSCSFDTRSRRVLR